VLFDERNFRVIGVTYDDPSLRFAYLNPERQRLQKQIEDVLPGRTVNLVSASADRSKIAVVSSGPQNPPLLQLVNLKTSRIDVFAEAYPPLNGMRFGEVRRYPYTSRDGVALVGLVTLPPQGEAKNLPVVVLPAGGLGYAIDAFDWFAQFLAQRGYAVFQAGARNLKELGDIEHMDELGSWMTSSQNDIVEGVDDLVAKGIADPSRICIAGAGNGGYIALSAMIVMPGKYACAISLAGFSDLRSIWQKAWDNARPAQHVFSSTLIRNRMNYSDDDVSRFSPARHAEAVQGPVLLIFGDRDSGKLQGDKMNEALLGAHKAVEYVTLRNEDGTLSRAEGRVALLNAVDKFLAAHIGK
jgi:dipeptidyl aminopeptidase/acylaminoacyl peptidase